MRKLQRKNSQLLVQITHDQVRLAIQCQLSTVQSGIFGHIYDFYISRRVINERSYTQEFCRDGQELTLSPFPCCFASCSPLQRFRVLRDQRQGQHQREADLRAPRRPHLRQDVRELGHGSGSHHGGSHRQTHGCGSAPPAAGMQLLVTEGGGAAAGFRRGGGSLERSASASAAPATAAFSLDSGSNPPHLVESLNSSRVISKLYHPISRANNHINRYCKKKTKQKHSNIREYKKKAYLILSLLRVVVNTVCFERQERVHSRTYTADV